MSIREQLTSIAEKRIIILDGAMGSIIRILNLDEKGYRGNLFADHSVPLNGCNDVLCLTRPGAIGAIHDTYLEAGADIIETCSFNSTSVRLADFGLEHLAYDISAAAARIARKSADKFTVNEKPRFVAGSMGPTSKSVSRGEIGWDELELSYYDNARGLLDGGADILLVETVSDILNAKAAAHAISRLLEKKRADVPVIVSAAVTEEGRLLSGQSIEAFFVSIRHLLPNETPWAVGLNCSFNASKLLPHLQLLSEIASCFISAYPNAGLLNQFGRYEEIPDTMAENIEPFLKNRLVNIIGGCCGSTPAHIAAIAEKAHGYIPHKIPKNPCDAVFSGLDLFHIENDIVHPEKIPFYINSWDKEVLCAELKKQQGRGLAGPINLENGEAEFLQKAKLIQSFGAAALVTLTDERSPTDGADKGDEERRKIEIAQRIYRRLHEIGYYAGSIVFDINTAEESPICAWIRDNCPGALIAL